MHHKSPCKYEAVLMFLMAQWARASRSMSDSVYDLQIQAIALSNIFAVIATMMLDPGSLKSPATYKR